MMTCELCEKEIVEDDETHIDDSGSYHQDCYDYHYEAEAAYWAQQFYGSRLHDSDSAESAGYDNNDYKNPEYIDRLIDSVDTDRG